jgi:putative DNA methylase
VSGMKLIEKDFPVNRLNAIALAEGNAKKPVYRMHKWWARRLGSVFRMITLAAFSPEDETETTIWQKFLGGLDLQGAIVLDPFMGGGTTIVEALRLGCRVVGVDINPIAWFVTKKEIEPVDIKALDAAFDWLEQTAGEAILRYYRTTCPAGHLATAMYYFWVKIAPCAKCGTLVRLFPNYELSRRDHVDVCVCPHCLQVNETSSGGSNVTCRECGDTFNPRKGVASRGIYRCPVCGATRRVLDAVVDKGAPLDMDLHAVEGYCPICGRFFKRVDQNDLSLWQEVKEEYERRRNALLIPRQAIPAEGRSDPRPINHGYTYFWQMFNERQLLCLSILLEHIMAIPDQNVRELMLIAFSDCLDANNMFCKYEIEWHKVSLMFGLHAYHPIERPAENNVWGTSLGRGTFVKCFEKVRRAKLYCQRPYERVLGVDGRRYTHYTGEERIEGQLVENFQELMHRDRAALLRCQSSEDLSFIPDKSIECVITDPPYFDNIQYSELADFFYVWLRLALRDIYPWFEPELSRRPGEVVKNEELGKTTGSFIEGLRRVFRECHRVLKDDGLLVFTFHHSKVWAWEGIGRLLLDSGFYVSATPVVRSEGKSGFHSSEGNIRYDCVLVCRKMPYRSSPHSASPLQERILQDSVLWVQRTLASGMPVNEVDLFTIVMGKTIEHYTKALAGEKVSRGGAINETELCLAKALQEMAALVKKIQSQMLQMTPDWKINPIGSPQQLALFAFESREKYEN